MYIVSRNGSIRLILSQCRAAVQSGPSLWQRKRVRVPSFDSFQFSVILFLYSALQSEEGSQQLVVVVHADILARGHVWTTKPHDFHVPRGAER